MGTITYFFVMSAVIILPKTSIDDVEFQKHLGSLIELLRDDNPDERGEISRRLAGYGEKAVPALRKALKNKNVNIRIGAVWAIGLMKPAPLDFIHIMSEAAKDSDSYVSQEAFSFMIKRDPAPGKLVESLLQTGKEIDDMKPFVIDSLRELEAEDPDSITFFADSLTDSRENVRVAACRALSRIGPEAKFASLKLIDTLKDNRSNVYHFAAIALHDVKPSQTPLAIQTLTEWLKDQDFINRGVAASALEKIASSDPASNAELIKMLTIPEDRESALGALKNVKPPVKDAIPALIQIMNEDETIGFRDTAAQALWAIASDEDATLQVLLKFLPEFIQNQECGDWRRRNMLYLASRLGAKARTLVPVVQTALKDKSRQVQVAAALALVKINGDVKQAIPVLIRCVSSKDIDGSNQIGGTQGYAAEALGLIGPQAVDAVPLLLQLMSDKYTFPPEANEAALALIRIAPDQHSAPALKFLESMALQGEYPWAALDAITALEKCGNKAVPILSKLLDDERRGIRRATVEALGNIGSSAVESLPALRKAMKDPKPTVRCAILEACTKIDATKSRTIYSNALNDRAWSVRFAALKGLNQINPLSKDESSAIEKMQTDQDIEVKTLASTVLKSNRHEKGRN